MEIPVEKLIQAIFIISLITNLTTEGVKALLDEKGATYSSTVLAAIISVLSTILVSASYMAINDIVLTSTTGLTIICLMWISFLVATVGYDKVVQAIKQIFGK